MPGMLGTARRLRRSQPSAGGCSVKHKPVFASVHVGRSVRRAGELGCRCVAAETDSALAGSDAPSDEVDTGSSRGLPIVQQEVREEDVLRVPTLRDSLEPRPSPFCVNNNRGGGFVGTGDLVSLRTIRFEDESSAGFNDGESGSNASLPGWAVRAGPHGTIYFEPERVTAAIVTCGGLCPGLNDVIQSIVGTLIEYGVPQEQIFGIRYGLKGFYAKHKKPVTMNSAFVDGVHLKGGTILGTSRGGADIEKIVHRIDLWGLDMVFVIGGNGGNAAANAIDVCCRKQGVECAVIGVPKSIDNDIQLIDRCFGFETAVDESQRALMAAHVEARSAFRGVGLVNVMGRSSGFIAMQASMASGVVDVCLIPEITFSFDKLAEHIETVLERKGSCVVCVAEGAGQELLVKDTTETDASGNPVLGDIGIYLAKHLKSHFEDAGDPIDLKYIDPTYMIRAIPTIPNDRIYCNVLGQNSVHAAFAGFTGATSGLLNTHYVLLPIPAVVNETRVVNTSGRKWNRLKTSIKQPDLTPDNSDP